MTNIMQLRVWTFCLSLVYVNFACLKVTLRAWVEKIKVKT